MSADPLDDTSPCTPHPVLPGRPSPPPMCFRVALMGRFLPGSCIHARPLTKEVSPMITADRWVNSDVNCVIDVPLPPRGACRLTPEEVFHTYAGRVYNLARRMLGHDADAEDVTQDVLLQVVRKLSTYRGESAFPTWLHRVTVNAALAHRRKRAARQAHQTSESVDKFLEDGHSYPNG